MFPFQTTPKVSARMRRNRKTDTKPEMVVRQLTHITWHKIRSGQFTLLPVST